MSLVLVGWAALKNCSLTLASPAAGTPPDQFWGFDHKEVAPLPVQPCVAGARRSSRMSISSRRVGRRRVATRPIPLIHFRYLLRSMVHLLFVRNPRKRTA